MTAFKKKLKAFLKKLPLIGNLLNERERLLIDSAKLRETKSQCLALNVEINTLKNHIGEISEELTFHINFCRKLFKNFIFKPVLVVSGSNDPNKYNVEKFNVEPEDYKHALSATKLDRSMFRLRRFCILCLRADRMFIDYQHGLNGLNGETIPNLREKLSCPHCHMNNRQRIVAKLTEEFITDNEYTEVYLTERVTPIYNWLVNRFENLHIIGSEYFAGGHQSGDIVNGIMHQDIMHTSFGSNSIDLIVSNDVLEHVPDPSKAFLECFRILRTGGRLVATIPFNDSIENSICRSAIVDGEVVDYLPQQFHGNPVSDEGALVFFDYGWDIVDQIKAAGFSNVEVNFYSEDMLGHFGKPIAVFLAKK